MRILSFSVENFKKIRVVEIQPKGRMTAITGRNGQGKTSVLDALWALFAGKKGIPEKPVRRGAEKSKLSATLAGDDGRPQLIVKRTIAGDRTTAVTVEAAPGAERPAGTPQAVLDELVGQMTFDPIAFITLEPKKQVELLRSVVKIDVDIDALNEENRLDYGERTNVNRKVTELRAQAAAVIFSPGLPKDKIDTAAIEARIREAGEANRQIVSRIAEKARLSQALRDAEEAAERHTQLIHDKEQLIGQLELELPIVAEARQRSHKVAETAKGQRAAFEELRYVPAATLARALGSVESLAAELILDCERQHEEISERLHQAQLALTAARNLEQQVQTAVADARMAWEAAPDGAMVDTNELMAELQQAQLTNREIEKRERRDQLELQVQGQERESARLTRLMEAREEQKREALANARMPVDGLTFTEEGVLFRGLPLEQLGEAEQIRVGCALAMASSPKLRCVPIARGESLDDESLKMIQDMAEENDFQVFMAMVDTTGKVGIVLEDGLVKVVNE